MKSHVAFEIIDYNIIIRGWEIEGRAHFRAITYKAQ